jgi:putative ABC transport system permease protein
MIDKMLVVFGLMNKGLFLLTTSITFAMFAVFYTIVYKATSNVYYNIVTAAK